MKLATAVAVVGAGAGAGVGAVASAGAGAIAVAVAVDGAAAEPSTGATAGAVDGLPPPTLCVLLAKGGNSLSSLSSSAATAVAAEATAVVVAAAATAIVAAAAAAAAEASAAAVAAAAAAAATAGGREVIKRPIADTTLASSSMTPPSSSSSSPPSSPSSSLPLPISRRTTEDTTFAASAMALFLSGPPEHRSTLPVEIWDTDSKAVGTSDGITTVGSATALSDTAPTRTCGVARWSSGTRTVTVTAPGNRDAATIASDCFASTFNPMDRVCLLLPFGLSTDTAVFEGVFLELYLTTGIPAGIGIGRPITSEARGSLVYTCIWFVCGVRSVTSTPPSGPPT